MRLKREGEGFRLFNSKTSANQIPRFDGVEFCLKSSPSLTSFRSSVGGMMTDSLPRRSDKLEEICRLSVDFRLRLKTVWTGSGLTFFRRLKMEALVSVYVGDGVRLLSW